MTTLLVAHGTRNTHGVAMIGDLAHAMSRRLDDEVRVGFVDVLGPDPAAALDGIGGTDTVRVVPAFLASGYHVRTDLPDYLDRAPRRTVVSEALGPDPALAEAMTARLVAAGARPGDAVVLAAAGSRDRQAQADVAAMGRLLSARLGAPVEIGFVLPAADGSGHPPVSEVVGRVRNQRPGARVAVASYLLADGLFARRLHDTGADVVADPLGLHPAVVDLACRRAESARTVLAA
ncbi:MAG: sirohydrochlorin chelatase [Gordonia sp. (in: high G+C Gram-positive bacteria)]|uniref:sirohydrochlorin chelatase n=1 Tax=Gordonia sp. (in: high G+C Gram-positive bacteria) TaxID=84139 RepID=UPI0039E4DD2B